MKLGEMEMDRRNPAPPVNFLPGNKDPLRRRKYLHLDERPPRAYLASAVSSPEMVAKWQFLPLLRYERLSKRVKRTKQGVFESKEKSRPICYAGHHDAALYATYAATLSEKYEDALGHLGLRDCVTAFRPSSGNCNVHFALECFNWISSNRPCVALAYDISKFFDTLDHHILKTKWCEILGVDSLPSDHFAVFRSLTRYATVDRDLVYAKFGISKHNPFANSRRRICDPREFRREVAEAGHIVVNQERLGIPQGTPISAILSNIYMLDFDQVINAAVSRWGGLYRRYCDDILCVVPPAHENEARLLIEAEIKKALLTVQSEKLDIRHFSAGQRLEKGLQYLGLVFDGERILVRPAGFGRYYSRMRSAVRHAAASRNRSARASGTPKSEVPIRRKTLNEKYSYAGRRNFVSYIHRTAGITGHVAVKRQISRSWMALQDAVERLRE